MSDKLDDSILSFRMRHIIPRGLAPIVPPHTKNLNVDISNNAENLPPLIPEDIEIPMTWGNIGGEMFS